MKTSKPSRNAVYQRTFQEKKKRKEEKDAKELAELRLKEQQRKDKQNLRQQKCRERKKSKDQAAMSSGSTGASAPPTPHGTISTPVSDHRTPAPIQSGWPYSNSSGTVTAAIHSQPTTPSHLDVLLPAMASGTPSEVNRFLKFRALNIAAEGLSRTVESIRAEDEEPRRNLTSSMNNQAGNLSEQQPQLPTSVQQQQQQQQQLDSKPAAAVTPKPFNMDHWSAHNQEEFNKLYMSWYGYVCGGEIKNAAEFEMLALRFFAFAVVECPNFLESFFVSNAGSPPTTHILDYLAEKKSWINEKTAEALISFIKERYIPFFQEGMTVKYRKLDEEDKLSELVDVTIVSVVQDEPGVFYVRFNDTAENEAPIEKQTTIERLQPNRIH